MTSPVYNGPITPNHGNHRDKQMEGTSKSQKRQKVWSTSGSTGDRSGVPNLVQ